MKVKMREWYDIKDRGIKGSEANEINEVAILGRTLRWTSSGLEYEADGKHQKELMKKMGLEETSKMAATAGVKDAGSGSVECDGLAAKAHIIV